MSDKIKVEAGSKRNFSIGAEKQTNKQYGHPEFYKLLDQMAELHSRKNHDYAGTSDPLKNLRACTRLELDPFMGVMVRLQDKWSRIEEFVKSKTLLVKNESVEDTLMDNAVYSLLAIILLREQEKSTDKADDYNAVEIDRPVLKFKAGDKVNIILRGSASEGIKNLCQGVKNQGVYVKLSGSVHIININGSDGDHLFYDDEIFPVEGN